MLFSFGDLQVAKSRTSNLGWNRGMTFTRTKTGYSENGAIKHMHTQSLLVHLNVNSSRQWLFVSSSPRDCDEEDVGRHQGFKEMIILTYGHAQRHQSWRGHCTKRWWMEACQKKRVTNEESLDQLDPRSLIGGPQSESRTRLLPIWIPSCN